MSYGSTTGSLDVELQPGRPPMLQVEVAYDPAGWAAAHRQAVRSIVDNHGAVQIRGLPLREPKDVGAVVGQFMPSLVTDTEAFASRDLHADGMYSSSSWPAKQQMCMHHELSYRRDVPGLMMFGCLVAPSEGGAIGLADAASVLADLPTQLVERFRNEGWILSRNYTDEIGLSVEDAFGTDDRGRIEDYCQANQIDFEWQDGGGLRTSQHRQAVARHPITGLDCWFNQVAFLSEWTLNPEVREFLIDMYGAEALPFNTRYGNGDQLEEDVVRIVNEAYDANTVSEPLQSGDLIIVDNLRMAHSRDPYKGDRDVVVAMSDAVRMPI